MKLSGFNSLGFVLIVFVMLSACSTFAMTEFNVLNFGANLNGRNDSTNSFLKAWNAACGQCKSPQIIIRIDGTIVAPLDYGVLGKSDNWFCFEGVSGVSIIGRGTFDAKGPSLWACKAPNSFWGHVNTLSFTNSNNIRINGLTFLNSQMFHIVINGCQNVHLQGVKIFAAGNSPNTDGIHVQLSRSMEILSTFIKTGDDCISIGPDTENLWIEQVTCGPGHGISIGSLAKDLKEEGVQNVTVKNTIFSNTQNGLRIKSWARPSSGYVQGVRFIGSVMTNVQNPIVIDQNYCPRNENCPGQVSGIKIKDINVNLTYLNKTAQSFCSNVVGKVFDLVRPNSCL
ncbi:hypothetical protein ES319_D10G223300v1 [Gossypium barbadense]|uniref:Endo-polygalacturonase n=1 Tax=Gossypium barbadense TaxID=3634 RepID=A0A5J5PUJ0_GOSBA|nr:hypothetical protein ES319_D10G223300v1 [Gossypium barbadense]